MRERVGISLGQLQVTVGVTASSFRRSNESFGICPLPLEEMRLIGMQPSESLSPNEDDGLLGLRVSTRLSLDQSPKANASQYTFLAKWQQTRYAIVPVHTKQEKALFRSLLLEFTGEDANVDDRTWREFAVHWHRNADGRNVFYKTTEHLKSYYTQWKAYRNVQRSIYLNQNAVYTIRLNLQNPSRKRSAPPPKAPAPLKIARSEAMQSKCDKKDIKQFTDNLT
jgi:hypothetical protein